MNLSDIPQSDPAASVPAAPPPTSLPQPRQAQGAGRESMPMEQSEPLPAVELEIGELAIQGFPGIDRDLVGVAIQRELSRLLAGPDAAELVRKLGRNVELSGGNFRMPRSMHPEDIGREIARALVEGLRE